jgi:hypothetical protein
VLRTGITYAGVVLTRWLLKGDAGGQKRFIERLFGIAA